MYHYNLNDRYLKATTPVCEMITECSSSFTGMFSLLLYERMVCFETEFEDCIHCLVHVQIALSIT